MKTEWWPMQKIRGIPLGWKLRQKLGIIPEGGEGSLQRSLLPSYEMHPSHWAFRSRSCLQDFYSSNQQPRSTSCDLHNRSYEPRSTLQAYIDRRHWEIESAIYRSLGQLAKRSMQRWDEHSTCQKHTIALPFREEHPQSLNQGRKITTHGRKDKLVHWRFTHDRTKLLKSGAYLYIVELKNMSSGSNNWQLHKEEVHPPWFDGMEKCKKDHQEWQPFKTRAKLPNPSRDFERGEFCH